MHVPSVQVVVATDRAKPRPAELRLPGRHRPHLRGFQVESRHLGVERAAVFLEEALDELRGQTAFEREVAVQLEVGHQLIACGKVECSALQLTCGDSHALQRRGRRRGHATENPARSGAE